MSISIVSKKSCRGLIPYTVAVIDVKYMQFTCLIALDSLRSQSTGRHQILALKILFVYFHEHRALFPVSWIIDTGTVTQLILIT